MAGVAYFKIVRERDGRFFWRLINPHGTPMFRSVQSYASEDEAVAAVEYARGLISQAPVMH